jgi:hypothetical protein
MKTIETQAGPLAVYDPAPETLAGLEALFPTVTVIEDQGERLLALVPVEGPRVLQGLRTGYGYHSPQPAEVRERMISIERLRIVQALAAFRARGFRGVLVPAACLTDAQLGELLFLRSEGTLENGLGLEETGFEDEFGPGTTDVLLSFVKDVIAAWKEAGVEGVLVTDMEPCHANWTGMQWRADLALVDDRIFVIRRELVPEDPLLGALVACGVTEVEHAPCVFLLPEPDTSAAN